MKMKSEADGALEGAELCQEDQALRDDDDDDLKTYHPLWFIFGDVMMFRDYYGWWPWLNKILVQTTIGML